jgi:hypothetical protein
MLGILGSMTDDSSSWIDFVVPGLGVRLKYPATTSDSEPVVMDAFRAHVRTMRSSDVYFEVTRQVGVSARQLLDREVAFLRSNPEVQISEPELVSFADCDASRFTVTFPDRERVFHYIERHDGVYRVVYDPRSPLSRQIIATIRFV